ncbi:MAG: 50S ribosomal protein L25 [Patescibacteria group bacterium]|jgi:large subunit ribosomal protein L25
MSLQLNADTRKITGKKVKSIRRDGLIPLVMYGKGLPTHHLQSNAKLFSKLFKESGTSSLVDIAIEDAKPIKALIKSVSLDPVSNEILHADLLQVNMKEKIRTEIPIEFVGDSSVVTEQDGKLVFNLDALEIECLPDDLVPNFEVNVSSLTEFDQAIHVSDIKIPDGMEILTDPELVIVVAQAPLTEAELEAELAEPEKTEEEAVAEMAAEEPAAEGEELGETKDDLGN